jgi:hypothetical protein
MMTLRCPGLGCEMLSLLALERDGAAIAAGFCLCRDSLARADRRQRLRACGKLRDRDRRPIVRVLAQPRLPRLV